MKLSYGRYLQAVEFMKTKARELERAIFEYEFKKGSKEAVIQALRYYQNEDGGFGKGIEPDFRLEASSPMATTVAFQILSQLGVGHEQGMVKKGITYLLETYDEQKGRWSTVPREVNNYPHAPWWHFNEKAGEAGFDPKWGNPTAEIIGYLREFREGMPVDFVEDLTRRALDQLLSYPDEMEMHEILCFYRLAERVQEPERGRMLDKLKRCISHGVGKSPEEWNNYSATPLTFVFSPESPFYETIDKDLIDMNLNYVIGKQNENGSWAPNWGWGQYEEAWETAKREWQGILTLNMLRQLHAFGRIEGE